MLLLRVPSVRLLLLLLLLLLRCPRRVDLLLMLRWVALRWVDLLLLLLRWVALLRRVALRWVCVTCRRCRRIVLASRRGGVACALEYRMSAVQRQNNIHIRKIVMPSGRPLPRVGHTDKNPDIQSEYGALLSGSCQRYLLAHATVVINRLLFYRW